MQVAVIGGGIIGFSCAVQILEYFKSLSQFPINVIVITDQLTPNTTGDGSAGLWGPFLVMQTDPKLIHKWSLSTHKFFESIWLNEDAMEAGICLLPVARVTTEENLMNCFWQDIVYGYTSLSAEQLQKLNEQRNKKFTAGVQFVTYTAEPIKFLPYLMKRFQSQGGKIRQQKVNNLQEFIRENDFNIICNCTGLGAKELVKDEQVFPVRGQVARISVNGIFHGFLDESNDGNYIIPNTDSAVLGGTHQENDYNTLVSLQDKKFIYDGCLQIMPGLKNAKYLYDWVGLRPSRTNVRLEKLNEGNKIVIHNYGHGGSGVTLAWGCAEHVLSIIKTTLAQNNQLISKL